MESSGWVSVRCIFDAGDHAYEERITLWRAASLDDGIRRAETEAEEYASDAGLKYLRVAQAYLLADVPDDGAEVFSLIRSSDLRPEDYVDRYFDTGTEHQNQDDE